MRIVRVATLTVVVLGLVSGVAQAAVQYTPEVEREASRLFRGTMSPFCPGRTLATCPSPQAAALKDSIRAQIAAGTPTDSIRVALSAAWGDLRASPSPRGFGLLAWIGPGVLLLLGAAVLTHKLRGQAKRSMAGTVIAPLDPEEQALLASELDRM